MSLPTPDPQAVERTYYAQLGKEGLAHAAGKPFSDAQCGQYLMDIGALLLLFHPPPRRVLDLGCGTGWTSRFLGRAGYAVTGLDLSPEAIEIARRLAAEERLAGVEFAVGDYHTLSSAGEFDYVLFYDALHHAADEAAALRAAATALRPGGALFAFEPGSGHSRHPEAQRAVKTYGVREKDMPPRRIIELGRSAGFGPALRLPLPHHAGRSLYRRDYHQAAARGRLWLEKLWGYRRMLGWMFASRSQSGLTILWKPWHS